MTIKTQEELEGIKAISSVVAVALREMKNYVKPGMSAHDLDEYGNSILEKYGAKSAPKLTYNFPGWTCICVNNEAAHGIPHKTKIFSEGDLINIDVSAELNGFWADNGGSFVLGNDLFKHQPLVDVSKKALLKAIKNIKAGVKISDIGKIIQLEAKKNGYTVIKDLVGHGVGRSLHEAPHEIPNFRDRFNFNKFKLNSVIAVETFISTKSNLTKKLADGWTLVGNIGGFVAQHEHTLMVTNGEPVIFTLENEIHTY